MQFVSKIYDSVCNLKRYYFLEDLKTILCLANQAWEILDF